MSAAHVLVGWKLRWNMSGAGSLRLGQRSAQTLAMFLH